MKDHAARAMRQLKISGVEAVQYEDLREDPDVPLRHFNIVAETVTDWAQKMLGKYGLHAVQIDDGLHGVYDLATGSGSVDDKFANLRTQYDAKQGDIADEERKIADALENKKEVLKSITDEDDAYSETDLNKGDGDGI